MNPQKFVEREKGGIALNISLTYHTPKHLVQQSTHKATN